MDHQILTSDPEDGEIERAGNSIEIKYFQT